MTFALCLKFSLCKGETKQIVGFGENILATIRLNAEQSFRDKFTCPYKEMPQNMESCA